MFALSRALSTHHARRASLLTRMVDAEAMSRQRRALSQLDPHLRRDIGLSDGEIETELRRTLWDVPANWRR
ncbi:MAG: DUF1127 domain-containing protein [Pseudomonadota bacterium]